MMSAVDKSGGYKLACACFLCNIMAPRQQHSSASTSTQSPRSAASAPHCAARDAAAATAAATADVADASAALRRLALALARAAACFNACKKGAQR